MSAPDDFMGVLHEGGSAAVLVSEGDGTPFRVAGFLSGLTPEQHAELTRRLASRPSPEEAAP